MEKKQEADVKNFEEQFAEDMERLACLHMAEVGDNGPRQVKNKIDWGQYEDSWPDGWQENCTTDFILSDEFFQLPAAWVRKEEKKIFSINNCIAKCRRTGKCYAEVYFTHKPGKPVVCAGGDCQWMDRFYRSDTITI